MYKRQAIPYTYDEPDYDENWEEGYFFTPSIVFLELEDGYRHNTWNRDTYRLEKKLLEYCAGRDITLGQCYTLKTDRHHPVSYTHLRFWEIHGTVSGSSWKKRKHPGTRRKRRFL